MRDIDLGPQGIPNQKDQREVSLPRNVGGNLWVSSHEIFEAFNKLPHKVIWPKDLDIDLKKKSYGYLQDFCDVMNLASGSEPEAFLRFHQERVQFLSRFADYIKRKRRYRVLNDFTGILSIISETYPELARVLTIEKGDLYCLLCEENQILAGSKNGLWYKEIKPENYPPEEREFAWQAIIFQMSVPLESLDRSTIELVPDRFIITESLNKLDLPQPARSIEELLEEAYYQQRYTVSPEGAEVRLQNAGDLKTMIVKQKGSDIMAKAITTKGEALIIVNLDIAVGLSPEIIVGKEPVLANILAEVYRDLVVAIEIPSSGRKKASGTIPIRERDPRQPTRTFIPRKRWVGEEEKEMPIRTPYEGPRRLVRPHSVIGHIRRANITEVHRLALMEYEEETSLRILDFLPEGHTYVRPHVRGGKEAEIKNIPIFIKRRIETKLRESLNLPDSH